MAQLTRLAYRQADNVSTQIDRWRDAVARRLENNPWLLGGGFAMAIAYQLALLAHTLTLTE
jgi:hypothetical protein